MPHFEPAVGEAIDAAQGEKVDLLLGRRTYDIFAGYWPMIRNSTMADSLNVATKYVATDRPDSLEWGPAEDVGADIVEGLRRIKSKDGADLISGEARHSRQYCSGMGWLTRFYCSSTRCYWARASGSFPTDPRH